MYRLLFVLSLVLAMGSCSKSNDTPPVTPVPDVINGTITDFSVTPINLNTPDKGTMLISMTGALYKVQFNVVPEAQANAKISFGTDSVLVDESRESGNFGQDVISYIPVAPNEVIFTFKEGPKKINGVFSYLTGFGGTFGSDIIASWRSPSDPSKPNAKAKEDLMNLVRRYMDSNGSEPGISPVHLAVSVIRQ